MHHIFVWMPGGMAGLENLDVDHTFRDNPFWLLASGF